MWLRPSSVIAGAEHPDRLVFVYSDLNCGNRWGIISFVTIPAGTLVPHDARDFGSYQLIAKLATGGMAEIFLARPTGGTDRDVLVLKRILPHLAEDEHFVTMFRDEADLAAKLTHKHICRVHAFGEYGGTWFIAMEYLHGVPLSRMMTRLSKVGKMLDVRVVAGIIAQACEGLHAAHEARGPDGQLMNVVHRDVSPPNIMVCADGEVKLLDFGIAKARGGSSRTRTGTVKGKNAYMSPEQILGKPLDRRSDVFALAIVMYEMLAIRRLFHRDSDFLTFKAITEEPIPDIRERRPDLPAGMREVVLRALARDVNARYRTAKEMADAVRGALATTGGVGKAADLSKMVAADFADELAAKQKMAEQPGTLAISADSANVPTLAVTSGQHVAVAPTVVDRPQKRGNPQVTAEGELSTPPRRPSRPPPIPGSTPPPPVPPPAVEVAPPTPASSPRMVAMPPAAMNISPMAPVGPTGQLTTDAVMSTDISTDLLGDRRRLFVIKAGVGIGLLISAGVALFLAASGGDDKAAAVPPDAMVEEAPDVVVKPGGDAGVSKDDIIAISKFGYFSISADEPSVIFIDDKRIGDTPLTRLPLSPGPHKVKAVGPGKKPKVKKFDITIFGGKDTDWGTIDW
jgi:serine/threonine protein kinase